LRDTEENRDESDVNIDGEIDSESECEQSEDETFRNVNKFVEIANIFHFWVTFLKTSNQTSFTSHHIRSPITTKSNKFRLVIG
jgi:hypothetical protein